MSAGSDARCAAGLDRLEQTPDSLVERTGATAIICLKLDLQIDQRVPQPIIPPIQFADPQPGSTERAASFSRPAGVPDMSAVAIRIVAPDIANAILSPGERTDNRPKIATIRRPEPSARRITDGSMQSAWDSVPRIASAAA